MNGSVEVKGRVLYASQEPWVFSGTLRENILFGQPYQWDWYNTVVEACALDKVHIHMWEGGRQDGGEEKGGRVELEEECGNDLLMLPYPRT